MKRYFIGLALVTLSAGAQELDEAALRSRIGARAPEIRRMLERGLATESKGGLLRAEPPASVADKQLIAPENADRQAVWALVAQRTRTSWDDVKARFASRSIRRNPLQAPTEVGQCRLAPANAPDVARLLQYLKQGMNFAGQKQFAFALAEFEPALTIDPNFLALNLNVGSARMGLRKYSEATKAFQAELKLVDCLIGLSDDQLANFGYFFEVNEQEPAARRRLQAEKLKTALPKSKVTVHYNLACAFARQGQTSEAVQALQAAVAAGFSDRQSLGTDPDLASVRQAPEFRELLSKVK